jgi:acyl-CoA dehydrogenase
VSDLVAATVTSIIDSHPETGGMYDERRWQVLREADLHAIGVTEARGGAGGTWQDAASAVRAAASRGAALPLAEALFGVAPAIEAAGLDLPTGLGTSTAFGAGGELAIFREFGGWHIDGVARRVPFGRYADYVAITGLIEDSGVVALCPADLLETTEGTNLAGEPRDDLRIGPVVLSSEMAVTVSRERVAQLRQLAALGRAVQIMGAIEQVLAATISYANQRVQFGRTISRFQAVAQQVATMAGEVAITSAAVNAAIAAIGDDGAEVAIAAAKARSSASAGLAARIAHQVFGALGFTQEHSLHRLTTRLWAWRDEAGRASEWHDYLGARALAAGPDGLWPLLTGTIVTTDPVSG